MGGRVDDCGGLENHCTARYRGFESLPIRSQFSQWLVSLVVLFSGHHSSSTSVSLRETNLAVEGKSCGFSS